MLAGLGRLCCNFDFMRGGAIGRFFGNSQSLARRSRRAIGTEFASHDYLDFFWPGTR